MTKKKILLTGANGFLGKAVAEELRQNNYAVFALSRSDRGLSSAGLKWLKCDLSDTGMAKKLRALISDIEYVVHSAAQMPMAKDEGPLRFINNNLNATLNLLVALPPKIKHFIYCSSTDVYGMQSEMPINEHNLPQPLTYYGATKLWAEHLIKIYFKQQPTVVTCLRFTQIYGPQEPKIKIIPRLIDSFLTDKDITIENMGQDVRDYLFVEDAADALIKSLNRPLNGTFNISSQKGVTIRSVIKALEGISGKRAKVNYLPVKNVSRYIFNSKKFRIATNWKPKITFLQGLKRQYEFANARH